MQKIIPNLWFDTQAEEAANFYCSIFPDSKIENIAYYSKEGAEMAQMPEGTVLTVSYQIMGQKFIALNGGKHFKLSEAISLMVPCASQEELDEIWDKLLEGGEVQVCGWLKDRYGLSWQVVPQQVEKWMADTDVERRERVMNAIYKMQKLDLATLEKAYEGID